MGYQTKKIDVITCDSCGDEITQPSWRGPESAIAGARACGWTLDGGSWACDLCQHAIRGLQDLRVEWKQLTPAACVGILRSGVKIQEENVRELYRVARTRESRAKQVSETR